MSAAQPVIGVLCCNEVAGRPVQAVASRFIEPLVRYAQATVLLVPAIGGGDLGAVAQLLDGLLLTGSRSHVAPHRYDGATALAHDRLDEPRDEVALSLADRMIAAGKPVVGICRGLQELNVLFGGTLRRVDQPRRHHAGDWEDAYERLFDLRHEVDLRGGGTLAASLGQKRITVTSVHEQGIDRLGAGLVPEAFDCEDGLVEAIYGRPGGAEVLGVQWHPEWRVDRSADGQAFFHLIGSALRTGRFSHGFTTEGVYQ